MESYFILILAFLALLAAFDLFVGVSNDAVNFLNSAIGSRIASFKTIMIVASLGVLIGATFSSGMMEIARSGVFNPQMFTFSEIIVIFFAVMVTDVLLLDIFNSFGLPTSTTVSIVFELLGGAVAAAAYKIWLQGDSFLTIASYINNEKALAIISGILVSVVVAFVAGTVVQYICRLIFTFDFDRVYRKIGGIFGGIALTSIFYFLVMKGLKGTSFMRKEYIDTIDAHTWPILISTFIVLTVLFQLLIKYKNTNIFRIIILSGTFALAFAFAGNDLVNFVGVPLAAYESYNSFIASGVAANLFTMESLKQAVQTPTIFLLLSGLIMVLTLWFSKKAHRVVQTSISLSSSTQGEQEQFGSSLPGRVIVRSALRFGTLVNQFMPAAIRKGIDSRMVKPQPVKGEIALPFDYVRASVNLVVAAILIASATSLKLPLSTTYVTFMVAMGSSFADGAWDRESAVYRISGVLMVISGWFLTAFSAFTACLVIALIIFNFGEWAAILLMIIATVSLIRSNFFSKEKEDHSFAMLKKSQLTREEIRASIREAVATNLDKTVQLYREGVTSFLNEDGSQVKKARSEAAALFDDISRERGLYYRMALEGTGNALDDDARHFYYRAFTNMKEAGHNLRSVMAMMENHLANQHRIYTGELRENLEKMLDIVSSLHNHLSSLAVCGETARKELPALANEEIQKINHYQLELLRLIDSEHLSLRSSELYLSILQCTREIINRYTIVMVLQGELNDMCESQRA
ncbi:inorganic phosphate transporter [Desulfovibrio sp. An276]|uniref:inorganic phosphate transporter n=1 Tax=Desulfovibrio sp. An276 TaxID=1965618 RepID=UPI000B38F300|nr:inorganic phosphate transporter [Desulfovibrio sp. An276]OUO52478.1 inorganic phosphate transporter [Desulfovibrio sp. An276]